MRLLAVVLAATPVAAAVPSPVPSPVPSFADDAALGQPLEVSEPADLFDWRSGPPPGWPSPPPATAPAFVLLDADTGQVLAERAASEPRAVASTVKLLTVLTALEVLSLDDVVVVGPEARPGDGGASSSVDPGERWSVADLLDAVMVRSGNDAARAFAGAVSGGDLDAFAVRMADTARTLGIDDAVIVEPTGLDDGNLLSARALGVIARAALADPRIRASAGLERHVNPDLGPQDNRNLLVGSYPGATGLKTGYTAAAGWSVVASASRDGRELVAVVLGSRTDGSRFVEAEALLDHGFALAATDLPALEARVGGAWFELVPAGHVWGPAGRDVTVGLAGTPASIRVEAAVDGGLLGARSVAVPRSDGGDTVGVTIADVVNRAMQQAHLRGTWPDPPTIPRDSG